MREVEKCTQNAQTHQNQKWNKYKKKKTQKQHTDKYDGDAAKFCVAISFNFSNHGFIKKFYPTKMDWAGAGVCARVAWMREGEWLLLWGFICVCLPVGLRYIF